MSEPLRATASTSDPDTRANIEAAMGLSWEEIERLASEDPGDRADREAHGFSYEDDWQDETLLCRNGCGLSYPEIVGGKIRDCRGRR